MTLRSTDPRIINVGNYGMDIGFNWIPARFTIDLFRLDNNGIVTEPERVRSMRALLHMGEALARINREIIDLYGYQSVYKSGVEYREQRGVEDWSCQLIQQVTKLADCDNLACRRAAELRYLSHDDSFAKPWLTWDSVTPEGNSSYHMDVWVKDPTRFPPPVQSVVRGGKSVPVVYRAAKPHDHGYIENVSLVLGM